MKIRISIFLAGLLFQMSTVQGQKDFTALEQQQISIATPGLFDKSQSFTVDFTQLKEVDYCYPLPVGKPKARSSRGIELVTKKGDAVKAVFAGHVRLSRYNATYGNIIVIRHNNGLETVYANNAQNLVKSGDRVKAGQTIAIVGEEGGVPKCYFGMMVNGGNVNPETLINVSNHKLRKRVFLFTNKGKNVEVSMIGIEGIENGMRDNFIERNDEFTVREQQVVSSPTAGLFDKSNSITINLWRLRPSDWSYPLPGSKVISPFGRRGRKTHTGVDIKTKANDNIRAAFEGKVRFSGAYGGYGNAIVIRHASGMETLYSHNSKNLVKSGEWVKAGQIIGLVGRTGRASTEHVHFEIRINGRPYNPALVFNHATQQLRCVKIIATKSGKIETVDISSKMAEVERDGMSDENNPSSYN